MTFDEYRAAIRNSTSKAELESLKYRCDRDSDIDWLGRFAIHARADIRLNTSVCEL